MATRLVYLTALALFVTMGCQSTARSPAKPLAMMPPAAIDDKPRPKAVAAARGNPGDGLSATGKPSGGLSTAAELSKKLDGGEEATYEFPIPPPPKETVAAARAELPPAPPAVPLTPTPPALPIAPQDVPPAPPASPLKPPPMTPPLIEAPTTIAPPPNIPVAPLPVYQPSANGAVLAPPVAVDPKPRVEAKLTSQSPEAMEGDHVANLRRLSDKANQRYATMDSYTMRIRRREVVSGKARPEELIFAKFRKTPFSFYMKWIGDEAKNREICYVQGKYDDELHTMLAPGDMFVFGGKHYHFKIDNPLVRSNSRYPINQAGFGPMIASFDRLVSALEKGETREGTAKYLGKQKLPEFEEPVEAVVQNLPAKFDPLFPQGGQRFWCFDVKHGLPALVRTVDHQGKEVEYYCHDRIQGPANLDEDDFNPYRLWKTGK